MIYNPAQSRNVTPGQAVTDAANRLFTTLAKMRMILVTAIVLALAGGASFAQSDVIDVDTSMFISAINQWLPMAMTIAAIGVGIAGGFKLAQFVGRMIVDAFDGKL